MQWADSNTNICPLKGLFRGNVRFTDRILENEMNRDTEI